MLDILTWNAAVSSRRHGLKRILIWCNKVQRQAAKAVEKSGSHVPRGMVRSLVREPTGGEIQSLSSSS